MGHLQVPRVLENELKQRLETTPKSILLLGPRQTGKSTLLRQLRPTREIRLSDEAVFRAHLKDPSLLAALVQALPVGSVVLIDEIQRIPSLLNTVQSLQDDPELKVQFLLTGSSARKLKRGAVNLLPGRLFRCMLFPLTYWELQSQSTARWDLERALRFGLLPEIFTADYGPELLSHYVESYLREEIQAEAVVRQVASFARFLDLAAHRSGQEINYSALASDSEIPKETLRRYFDILEDTLLIHRIPGFTEVTSSRKALQREKILFFDTGVRNAILGIQNNVLSSVQMGELFEQWLITQVLALQSYQKKGWKLHYYRDDLKNEVDLVVDRGPDQALLAIEIKYAQKFDSKDLRGLHAFEKAIAPRKVTRVLVYRGDVAQVRGDVRVLPYTEFLDLLAADRLD